jgi:hypothetical protein
MIERPPIKLAPVGFERKKVKAGGAKINGTFIIYGLKELQP